MKSEGQSIYRDSQELFQLFSECELMMAKKDRPVFIRDAKIVAARMIEAFVMAYEYEDERWHYFKKLKGYFAVCQAQVIMLSKYGVLTSPHPDTGKKPLTMKKELAECLDRIDTALRKWQNRIIVKGQAAGRETGTDA